MLMEPICRRDKQASRTPVDADSRLALLPQARISFPRQDHDVRAGTVAVAAGVSSGRILLEVGAHRIGGKVQPNARRALASNAAVS